jgi:hypothetical protein
MQPGVLRFLLVRLRPAPFSLVLAGLALAALAPVGPAIAGEVGVGVPAVPWHRLPAGDGEAGFQQDPAGFLGLTGLEFVLLEVDEGVPWRSLFFRAGDGLRIGAQGSLDPGSGNLRAMVVLKLNF